MVVVGNEGISFSAMIYTIDVVFLACVCCITDLLLNLTQSQFLWELFWATYETSPFIKKIEKAVLFTVNY